MLERWLTSRCWREDAPALTTARRAIVKFLEQQDQRASGTEPFAAAARPDTFTYHFGKGRGVRWHDLFAQVHFLRGAISPASWLRQVYDEATTGTQPDLVT